MAEILIGIDVGVINGFARSHNGSLSEVKAYTTGGSPVLIHDV